MPTNQNFYNVTYNGVAANLTPPNHRTPVLLAWLYALLSPMQWVHDAIYNNYANGSVYGLYNDTKTYNFGDRVIDINNSVYECEFDNVFNYSPRLNTGLGVGSYEFISGGGTDQLGNGTQINFNNFNGTNNTRWQITVLPSGIFEWTDNRGNSGGNTIVPIPILLSYGVTITWGTGYALYGDTYSFTATTDTIWVLVCNDFRGARARVIYNSQHLTLEWILNEWFHAVFRQPEYNSGWAMRSQLPDIYIADTGGQNSFFITFNEELLSSVTYNGNFATQFVYNGDIDDTPSFTIMVPNSSSSPNVGFYNSLASGLPSPLDLIYVDTEGANYTAPVVTITGGGGGSGAIATATVFNGVITTIQLTNPGNGYTSQPTITIADSGGGTGSGASATALLLIADDRIRALANQYVLAGITYDIKTY